jgi:nucleoside-diphosphate-sugar epimerase
MKILLAGGAGYIGSQLAPALRDHGYEVEVIDLCWFGNKLPPDIKVIRKDLFDCTLEDLKGYDQLIFLAGLSNDPMAEYSPARNFISNAALPAYLAFIAKKAGISRYIYASSCSVYGYTVNKMYDETDPVACAYPYGISKLQGESGVFQLNDDSFSVISLRQGTVSGHSPRMRMDLIVNTMFKTAMTEGKVVINNPAIWRPIFDLRDTVTAFLRAVQADHTISGVFNVASGNFTVGQVGDIVRNEVEQLTGKKIDIDLRDIQDFRNYKVSIEKAKTYLGYQPQYDIKETIDNLFENKDEYGDFDRDEFYNIRVFRKL